MNTQKGFASILIILLVVVAVGGGIYFYTQNNKDIQSEIAKDTTKVENNSSTTNQTLTKDKDKFFISAGDKLGGMTVRSVEPFKTNVGQITGLHNVKVKLTGPITLTGMYYYLVSEIGFSGYCMSDFDEESLAKLPSLSITDKTDYFCIRNEEVAETKLRKNQEKTKVTVTIDNFEINRYPAEVIDWADLVDVI